MLPTLGCFEGLAAYGFAKKISFMLVCFHLLKLMLIYKQKKKKNQNKQTKKKIPQIPEI